MKQLENDYLRITVEERGAELSSLFDKGRQKDLLWSGDAAFWGYHAPVLFPIVGMVNGEEYRYGGKTFHTRQHGFARQSDFVFLKETENSLTFRLTQSEETLEKYPFDFCLDITYELRDSELTVKWDVTNPSAEETMYFSIGAHPAFRVPLEDGDRKEDCYVLFHGKDQLSYILVDLSVTAADPSHVYTMMLDDGYLKLERHLFDIDTFIFENGQVEKVSVCGPDKKPYITVSCPGFPYFGLWTKSDEAPFVCLEPWFGRLDDKGFTGELPDKTGIRKLEPGETFETSYEISVE